MWMIVGDYRRSSLRVTPSGRGAAAQVGEHVIGLVGRVLPAIEVIIEKP
jgi:hypothetical protein